MSIKLEWSNPPGRMTGQQAARALRAELFTHDDHSEWSITKERQ